MKKFQATMIQFFTMRLQFQPRDSRLLLVGVFIFTFLFAATPATNQAQEVVKGEWFIDFSRPEPDKVRLALIKQQMRGSGKYTHGSGVSISEIQGLSREQASGGQKDAKFRIVREAGTFEMEGSFRQGKGAGFWTLVPNQNFISAMQSRGYNLLTDKDAFYAALFDINTKFIEGLKAAGYDRLSFKDLLRASIFKIDAQFVKEVQAMGFERQPFETLVDMRIAKITTQFISKLRSADFENLTIKELKDLGIHRITPEFVNEIKAEGFASVSQRQAVELKIHRVDGDFIRRVKAKGFTDVTLKQLVNLRIHDIVK